MSNISVLQIGSDDWTPKMQSKDIDWQYTSILDLPTMLAFQKDPYVLEQSYVVLTDDVLDSTLLSSQLDAWPPLRTLYFAHEVTPEFQSVLDERRAFFIQENTPEAITKCFQNDLSSEQIGFSTRFSESQFLPLPSEGIHFKREGRFSVQYSGNFGLEWQQIGTLQTYETDFTSTQANLVWLDYSQTGSVEVQVQFVFYKDNDIQTIQVIEGAALRELTTVGGLQDYQAYQILVFARGEGLIDLHALHQRRSRHGLGMLLPGDDWQLTTENEEILSYFNPGDRQAPLIVNFSGLRLHGDAFEMKTSLDELGTPYLLFTDSRIQGGAFDIGTPVYQQAVIDMIKKAMATLNLKPEDVILTGGSMGSFPALYYAADIKPSTVMIAKPILNLGTFTSQAEFAQLFNQDWILDVRRYLVGRMNPEDTEELDQRLWQHIQNVDWSKIKISLFTMSQDEYDGNSLLQLNDFFTAQQATVTHVTAVGSHTDKIPEMISFFMTELKKARDNMRQEDQ